MRRLGIFSMVFLLAAIAAPFPPAHAQGAPTDSARAALEAELAELLAEIDAPPGGDPFEDEGRPPDLIVVSTNTVLGEVAPCG